MTLKDKLLEEIVKEEAFYSDVAGAVINVVADWLDESAKSMSGRNVRMTACHLASQLRKEANQ